MELTLEPDWLISILLVSIRVAMIFLFTPLLLATRTPTRFRLLFVLALSMMMLAGSIVVAPAKVSSLDTLARSAVNEMLIGGLLAFGLITAFSAFLIGGRLLDFQMGFGIASVVDPATNTQAALIGTLLQLSAVMVFFMLDGHHLLLKGLAYSFERLPPGTSLANLEPGLIIEQFGLMFIFAITIVAPAMVIILLLDAGLAVIARTMPQVNIFFVSFPLKIFAGLSVMAMSSTLLAPVMQKLFEKMFLYWHKIIG